MMSGGCLCGAVRFDAEIDADPVYAVLCHCRDCQRSSGACGVPVLGLPRERVTVRGETRGYTVISDRGAPTTRHFCPMCGSQVFGEPGALPHVIGLHAGCLDDPSQFQPRAAVFTRNRPDWTGLQEFEGLD